MLKLIHVCIMVMLLLLGGCATPDIKPVSADLNNSNSSVINFNRPSQFVNGGISYRVFANDEFIGKLNNGRKFQRRIPAGELHIKFKAYEFGGLPSIGSKELDLVIDPGYRYDVMIGSAVDSVSVIGSVTAVSKTTDVTVNREKLPD